MKLPFFFCFFFFLNDIYFEINGQCKNNANIWQSIQKLDSQVETNKAQEELLKLKKLKENCLETKDSVYTKILHIIGRNYWQYGKIELAISFTKNSIEINENSQTPNYKHLALSHYNLATYQLQAQNLNEALSNYLKSSELLTAIDYLPDLNAESLRLASSLFYLLGDYQKSIQNADKAIHYSEKFSEEYMSAIAQKIQALIQLNQIQAAETLLLKAISITKKTSPNSLMLANLFSLYAESSIKKEDFSNAQKIFQKSLIIHKKLKYKAGVSQVLIAIGDCYLIEKNYKLAIKTLKRSLIYSNENNIYRYRALDKVALGYNYQNLFIEALKTFQIAFSELIKNKKFENIRKNPELKEIKGKADNEVFLDLIQHKAETWLAFYHHTHQKEYLQNALETFSVADKMVDYMRQEHIGYQSKLYWRDKTHRLYENAIEVCYLLKNYEKAFYFFEKSRAVLLNDKINNLSANQLLSDSDQMKERDFQEKISKYNAELDSETNESNKSKINIQLLDIQEDQQRFIKGLALKYPTYFSFKYDTSMYSIGQFKQYLLKRKTSFIEYFKGDSANYQLVIKPNEVNIIKQKPTDNHFQYLIKTSDLGKRVIISQDGEFVPLDTLRNTKGVYLLNEYAFSHTYSAQYLLRNAEKKVSGKWFNNFIGFAPVNYSKSMALPSLLGSDDALSNVSSNYFWAKKYQKEAATKLNFSKKASDYKIIQLFTHADADNINKEPTIFFVDSAMKVSELESFGKFNTDLLVLSACKTNVGKIIKGEGTLSMAREFAGLGIPASITTLWSVENEATYQITELFYKYLKAGEPKDIALQKAKLEYLELNSKEKQAPKYWSAFVLVGETAPLNLPGTEIYLYCGLFLLILAIIIYVLVRPKSQKATHLSNFTN
ncbi:MAG: CHAT domain-containing tetratricopeptide repeat protein [Bacteroidota bacterium]